MIEKHRSANPRVNACYDAAVIAKSKWGMSRATGIPDCVRITLSPCSTLAITSENDARAAEISRIVVMAETLTETADVPSFVFLLSATAAVAS